MSFEVQNTQNKIYNIPRRTYIDEGDCKEGEQICRNCEGIGQVTPKNGPIRNCSQCLGRGIVDWVTQAVERPAIMTGQNSSGMSSSSSSPRSGKFGTSSCFYTGTGGTVGPSIPLNNQGNIRIKPVTNYKRRRIV